MPAAATPLFVSLDPEPAIAALIERYKTRVRELVGEQLYLADPPHMTAFLASFIDETHIAAALAQLSEQLPAVDFNIVGWHVFAADRLTGNHTLVLQLDEAAEQNLREVQRQLIEHLAPLRDVAASTARYGARWEALDEKQRASVTTYGFPFTASGWHPHFTVASIKPVDWPVVAADLLAEPPQTAGCCPTLTLYRLAGLEPQSIQQYALTSTEVTV